MDVTFLRETLSLIANVSAARHPRGDNSVFATAATGLVPCRTTDGDTRRQPNGTVFVLRQSAVNRYSITALLAQYFGHFLS